MKENDPEGEGPDTFSPSRGKNPEDGSGGERAPYRPPAKEGYGGATGKGENSGVTTVEHVGTPGDPISATMADALKVAELRKEGITFSMESTKPLPVLDRGKVSPSYLEGEKKKLRVIPGLACSTCTLGPECPEFQEGYVCAFKDAFQAFPVRDVESVLELMREVVDANKARWRMGRMIEKVASGGMPDPNVTRLGEVVMAEARQLLELQQEVNKVTVSLEGPAGGGTQERGPGILSRLFGGGGQMGPPTVNAAPERALGEGLGPPGGGRGSNDAEAADGGLVASTYASKGVGGDTHKKELPTEGSTYASSSGVKDTHKKELPVGEQVGVTDKEKLH